jgi:hypothetical protein
MFETLPNPSVDVLLIAGRAILLVGALCVFALAFIRWRRTDEMNTQRLQQQLQQQLDRTFVELRSLHETVSVMSARLEGLSERTEVGTRLAPAGIGAPQRGYDMAARLAKNGADIDELVANCGITRHEAELLVRLHSAKRTGGEVAIGRLKQQAQESTRAPERAPAPSWPMQSAEVELAERQQVAAAAAAGRKRGSLLSVVG